MGQDYVRPRALEASILVRGPDSVDHGTHYDRLWSINYLNAVVSMTLPMLLVRASTTSRSLSVVLRVEPVNHFPRRSDDAHTAWRIRVAAY